MKRIVATLSLLLVFILAGLSPAYSAPSFANNQFKEVWQYSDKLVDEVPGAGRGFTWGPNSFGILYENYQEAIGGKRQVQYFDKSRMEISTNGNYVTNGLLTKELVTGLRQDGNAKFTQFTPSTIQIAGDDNSGGGNSVSPTYASFAGVVSITPGQNTAEGGENMFANLAINKAGQVTALNNPPDQVHIGGYDNILGHNLPQIFIDFQLQEGKVWNGFGYSNAKIYTDNPTANVFGYAISEPYWVKAVVAGQEKDVLVQLFERRVLTYTPTNLDPYKVEMGNIGQHYYKWRYGGVNAKPITVPAVTIPTATSTALGSNFPVPSRHFDQCRPGIGLY